MDKSVDKVAKQGTTCQFTEKKQKVGRTQTKALYFTVLPMLIGEYQHKMDAKKRLPLPARFREQLGSRVIVTRGLEGCLFVYSVSVWNEVADKLIKAPQGTEASRGFTRLLLSSANELEFDALGRVLVPESLKDYAGLSKTVKIVGVGNRLELWSNERWEQYRDRAEKSIGDMAEKMGELGLY